MAGDARLEAGGILEHCTVERYDAGAAVIQHDARAIPMPDESVDLIVTSPPYFALRAYQDDDGGLAGEIGAEDTVDEFLDALDACTAEWRRLLKPTGSLFVNLGDKYAGSGGHNNANIISDKSTLRGHGHAGGVSTSTGEDNKIRETPRQRRTAPARYQRDSGGAQRKSLMGLPWRYAIRQIDAGWTLRAEIVWSKPNGIPESVKDRVRRSHEQWFHLTKRPVYYSGLDEIREPYQADTARRYAIGYQADESARTEAQLTKRTNYRNGDPYDENPLGKTPGSVWSIPTEPLSVPDGLGLVRHFAAFPQEWPRRLISGWCPPGVCPDCGEGLEPVVHVDLEEIHTQESTRAGRVDHGDDGERGQYASGERLVGRHRARIVGYSCACRTWDSAEGSEPAVVLDPFGGTGTVAGVARALGRFGVSSDLSAGYNRLASWRIFESGHFAKSEGRGWRDRQGVML